MNIRTIKSGLLPKETPLIFADGSVVYKKFVKEYITHKKGFFILAPSGAGKTHYIKHQPKKHWIDGDILWMSTRAHPQGAWWRENTEIITAIDQRSDIITAQAKQHGFWIMGASNHWLQPDAIVIPHWNTHKKYIRTRETMQYDGGATSDRLAQVKKHRQWILRWVKNGVPVFRSIDAAAHYISVLASQ